MRLKTGPLWIKGPLSRANVEIAPITPSSFPQDCAFTYSLLLFFSRNILKLYKQEMDAPTAGFGIKGGVRGGVEFCKRIQMFVSKKKKIFYIYIEDAGAKMTVITAQTKRTVVQCETQLNAHWPCYTEAIALLCFPVWPARWHTWQRATQGTCNSKERARALAKIIPGPAKRYILTSMSCVSPDHDNVRTTQWRVGATFIPNERLINTPDSTPFFQLDSPDERKGQGWRRQEAVFLHLECQPYIVKGGR